MAAACAVKKSRISFFLRQPAQHHAEDSCAGLFYTLFLPHRAVGNSFAAIETRCLRLFRCAFGGVRQTILVDLATNQARIVVLQATDRVASLDTSR